MPYGATSSSAGHVAAIHTSMGKCEQDALDEAHAPVTVNGGSEAAGAQQH